MDRRDFLRGALISTSAAACTALIKLPTPEEVRALVPQRDIVVSQPEHRNYHGPFDDIGGEVYMKSRKTGEFLPVGYVTRVELVRDTIEEGHWDGSVRLIPGLMRASMDFRGR